MLHPEVSHYLDGRKIGVFAGAPPVPGGGATLELFLEKMTQPTNWEAEQPRT
jgi:hypothetical protein